MKLTNILVKENVHLAACTDRGLVDLTAAGFPLSLEQLIMQGDLAAACSAGVAFARIRSALSATNWLMMVAQLALSPEAFW